MLTIAKKMLSVVLLVCMAAASLACTTVNNPPADQPKTKEVKVITVPADQPKTEVNVIKTPDRPKTEVNVNN